MAVGSWTPGRHMLDFSRNSDHRYWLYITGDTMLSDGLEDIPRRCKRVNIAHEALRSASTALAAAVRR